MDETIRRLERDYLADPTDLAAYEGLLAARLRAGIPVDDLRTPPGSVEAEAILLRARVRSEVTTEAHVVMAAGLGHAAAAQLVAADALGYAGFGAIDWSVYWQRERAIRELGDHRKIVAFACDCAEPVLGIFEHYHPNNARPRAIIDASRAWVVGSSAKSTVRAVGLPRSSTSRAALSVALAAGAVAKAVKAADIAAAAYLAAVVSMYAISAVAEASVESGVSVEYGDSGHRRLLSYYLLGGSKA